MVIHLDNTHAPYYTKPDQTKPNQTLLTDGLEGKENSAREAGRGEIGEVNWEAVGT